MSADQKDDKEWKQKEESIFEFASMIKELDKQIKELTEKQKWLLHE